MLKGARVHHNYLIFIFSASLLDPKLFIAGWHLLQLQSSSVVVALWELFWSWACVPQKLASSLRRKGEGPTPVIQPVRKTSCHCQDYVPTPPPKFHSHKQPQHKCINALDMGRLNVWNTSGAKGEITHHNQLCTNKHLQAGGQRQISHSLLPGPCTHLKSEGSLKAILLGE